MNCMDFYVLLILIWIEVYTMFPQVSGTRERGSGETHGGGVWRLPPNSREIRGGRRGHKNYKNIYKLKKIKIINAR